MQSKIRAPSRPPTPSVARSATSPKANEKVSFPRGNRPAQSARAPESGPHPDSAFHSLFLPFGRLGDRKRAKGREILEPASLPVR